ncbi:MAG: hypothetical protein K0R92_1886 [Lachnospiraceae bacterium]|jgi:hypothetical protein|nr:hypothetical protein [Lachnospiraceae bacterium]
MELKYDEREVQLNTISKYHVLVDEYCRENDFTIFQYEKQCFMACRVYGDYPEPELHNPKRGIDINKSEQCKEYEHK